MPTADVRLRARTGGRIPRVVSQMLTQGFCVEGGQSCRAKGGVKAQRSEAVTVPGRIRGRGLVCPSPPTDQLQPEGRGGRSLGVCRGLLDMWWARSAWMLGWAGAGGRICGRSRRRPPQDGAHREGRSQLLGRRLVQHLQEGPALLAWVLLAGKVISCIRFYLLSRLPAARGDNQLQGPQKSRRSLLSAFRSQCSEEGMVSLLSLNVSLSFQLWGNHPPQGRWEVTAGISGTLSLVTSCASTGRERPGLPGRLSGRPFVGPTPTPPVDHGLHPRLL